MNLVLNNVNVGHKHPLTEPLTMSFGARGMHVVLGANGAGKTTLLRTVLGVQAPLDGHITMDLGGGSVDANDPREWGKHVAFVPSMPPKHVGLTVAEVLSLSGPWEEAVSHHPQLEPWLNQRLSTLSDGQAQQVMVARAMLQSNDWLMLDEPTAFLDVRGQRHLWGMLTTHLNRGGSVMMATHDLRGVNRWMQEAPVDVLEVSSIHVLSSSGLSPLAYDASLDALEAALG
ncbi:MAG: ATP-binding cassette domain-containing protein [Flavobacteriales bacterium]